MNYMLGEEIADLLASNGLGTVQTDIFLERLPQNTASGLVLASLPGVQPEMYLDTLKDAIMFIARDKDGTAAYKKLAAIRDLLHRGQNYDTPNFHIYFSYAVAGIAYVDTDLNGGMIYSLTIDFIYEDINAIS